MKTKRGINKTWIYILALVVLILLVMFVFRDNVAFSPKDSADDVDELDTNEVKTNNFLGFDEEMDGQGLKMASVIRNAVAVAEAKG